MAVTATMVCAGPARVIEFDVLLDGKRVGVHRFEIERNESGEERVLSQARFDVKLLGFTVYRYRHESREVWRDGCLLELTATTNDNGERLTVQGSKSADGFLLRAPEPGGLRSGCVSAYAYWNPDRLLQQRELLNPQTGRFDAVRFESLGSEQISAAGTAHTVQRHRLRSEQLRIDLWYDGDGRWLQLASPARGDRELLYRLRP